MDVVGACAANALFVFVFSRDWYFAAGFSRTCRGLVQGGLISFAHVAGS